MLLLTNSATVYLDGSNVRQTFSLYKTSSAQNHRSSDDQSLKFELIKALNAPFGANKIDQGDGVVRFKINNGNGYLVYKRPAITEDPTSAAIFHYHWNYTLDLPLSAM